MSLHKTEKALFLARRQEQFAAMIGKTTTEAAAIYIALARKAERLRKRYENECSYEWANTDTYEKGTTAAEARLVKAVTELGLCAYLQTDCRGATLYVDTKAIPANNYSASLCVYL